VKRSTREMFEKRTDEAMENGAGPMLREIRDRLRRGDFYDPDIAHAIFQTHMERRIDIVDAWAFAQIWTRLRLGEIAAVTIDVGSGPSKDVHRAENQATLSRALERPQDLKDGHGEQATFEAWIDQSQNCAGCDGTLRWSTPIAMGCGEGTWTCGPQSGVPLEVGTTCIETTLGHLLLSHALARWPYGSECITLFVAPNPLFRVAYEGRRKIVIISADGPTLQEETNDG
jgi:hypothetical protein